MQIPLISADEVKTLLPYHQLIEDLREAFKEQAIQSPQRVHYPYPSTGEKDNTLLIMPSWKAGGQLGVKIVTVSPDNFKKHMPTVQAIMLLFETQSGSPLMILDGSELTVRRTVATSALAASLLSREDSSQLLIVGTGRVASQLTQAYQVVRPLKKIMIWGRDSNKAQRLAAQLQRAGYLAQSEISLEEAVSKADIISCATLSSNPLIQGAWLKPGQHVDLIGSFKPDMREVDKEALERSEVYIDTNLALSEAGEFSVFSEPDKMSGSMIKGDLFHMCGNPLNLRNTPKQITCFKSVGYALEDLVAATLVFKNFHYNEED